MSDFYQRLANTAERLIADKGTVCTITSAATQGGFNPSTGLPLDDLPATTQQGVCVILNYSTSLENAPESLIEVGDKKILLSANNVLIDGLNGTVSALNEVYTIMSVKELNPAGIKLIYEIHGRL